MSHNNFKNAISVATIFALSVCLIPESVQAGKVRFSGRSVNTINFRFNIDDLVVDTLPDNNNGKFPKAIQDFELSELTDFSTNFNAPFCGASAEGKFCSDGNLTVTKYSFPEVTQYILPEDSKYNEISGLYFPALQGVGSEDPDTGNSEDQDTGKKVLYSLKDLNELFSEDTDLSFDNNEDLLRYDVKFDHTSSAPQLTWFIQSNDPELINNLSSLTQFKGTVGGIYGSSVKTFEGSDLEGSDLIPGSTFTFDLTPQPVPEPSDTAGFLLVSGALGAVSLLKRHKRPKKLV